MRALRTFLASAAVLLTAGSLLPVTSTLSPDGATAGEAALPDAVFNDLPVSFEANAGQLDPEVNYLARGANGQLSLTDDGPVFSLHASALTGDSAGMGGPSAEVRMDLVGASPGMLIPQRGLPGVVNYFRGSDPSDWHTAVPTYGAIRYRDVYPGVDLLFTGTRGELEYDFVLEPGAKVNEIALRFDGIEGLGLGAGGNLVIETAAGSMVHQAPYVYQPAESGRRPIDGSFAIDGERVTFDVGAHDPTLPLVIDPVVLGFSTFIGGTGEETVDSANAIAVDSSGAAYVTGVTRSTDYPTTTGAYDEDHNGGVRDAFVSKLSPSGDALAYSTFIGGTSPDDARGISIDSSGAAYVTGFTFSTDYPTTAGAYDQTHGGGGNADAFVTKLSPAGDDLAYSTFLGGGAGAEARGIAVDSSGAAYVTGETLSSDYPITEGAYQMPSPPSHEVFVTKVSPAGDDLAYSTLIGGTSFDTGTGIAVDAGGAAYVTGYTGSSDYPTTVPTYDDSLEGGSDGFVSKLSASGDDLAYSTLVGGSGGDVANGIAVDAGGAAYMTGYTFSSDYPTTAGAYDQTHGGGSSTDGFVTKLSSTGINLTYSTFIGGSGREEANALALGSTGAAYVTGYTESTDYPTTSGTFDATHNAGQDGFVTKLSPTGNALAFSTFIGGAGYETPAGIATDSGGAAYVTGFTASTDFPTTAGAHDGTHAGGSSVHVFVTKLVETPSPAPPTSLPTAVCSGASATVMGTDAAETLTGTGGDDVIAGLGGNDIISGSGGNDLVCGGDGNDKLNGGGGKDKVLGDAGNDQIKGGGGNDRLKGGTGKDSCSGGGGKDKAGCEKETKVP